MNEKRLELVNELIRAQSCAETGNALHGIVADLSPEARPDELSEMAGIVLEHVTNKLRDHCGSDNHDAYICVTGMDANLLFIAAAMDINDTDDLEWTMAYLNELATMLEEVTGTSTPDLDHVRAILDYCFDTYPVLHSRASFLVIAFPDIDLECNAEFGYIASDIPVTFINDTRYVAEQAIDALAYESAAVMIADEITEDALDLMEATTVPEIRTLPESDIWTNYMLSIKLGLAHNGPYEHSIDCISDDEEHARLWHEFILNLGS